VERTIHWREYGETLIHPVALAFALAMGLWLMVVKREKAVLPIALVACLIPVAQRIVVATLDFNMSRLLILFGWTRLLVRGETGNLRWCRLDTALCIWLTCGTVAHFAREGSLDALIYRLGLMFDGLGIYFLFRMLLRSAEDVSRSLYQLAIISCIVGSAMLIESVTARNLFSVFGGVPEYSSIREGRLRCQGAFPHPIMSGSFGAGLVSVLSCLTVTGAPRRRALALAGALAAVVIVVTSSSSGPALALIAAFAGVAMFPARAYMRWFRWGTVIVLVVIHFVREAPVWHLLGRASDVIGGTGYHRVRLITGFVDNWDEWILAGTPSTAHWGWGLQDITNEFVYQGVTGGIITLLSFLAILVIAFRYVGQTLRATKRARHLSRARREGLQLLAWGLGASLAAHCVNWLGVAYFGQMQLILYMWLAFIATIRLTPELQAQRVPEAARTSRTVVAGQELPARSGVTIR
jgi:hypothetical protein